MTERHTSRPELSGRLYFNDSPDPLAVVSSALSGAFFERARHASSAAAQMVSNIDRTLAGGSDTPAPPREPRETDEELETQPAPRQRRRKLLGHTVIQSSAVEMI
jgi:hypothetical protein